MYCWHKKKVISRYTDQRQWTKNGKILCLQEVVLLCTITSYRWNSTFLEKHFYLRNHCSKFIFKKTLIIDFLDANSASSSPNKTIFSSDFGLMCCTRFVIILRRKLQNSTYLITKMMLIEHVLSRECGTGESKEKKVF